MYKEDSSKDTNFYNLIQISQMVNSSIDTKYMSSERFKKFRVVLKPGFENVKWVKKRMDHGYLNLKEGMTGTVVCQTWAGDKYGVQFDTPIWDDSIHESKMNNGCHGRGELHYSIYLYKEFFEEANIVKNHHYYLIV
jgi:hypothetical protein